MSAAACDPHATGDESGGAESESAWFWRACIAPLLGLSENDAGDAEPAAYEPLADALRARVRRSRIGYR